MKNIIPEKEIIFKDPEKFLSWGDNQTGIAVLCDELHESRTGVCFLYSDRTEVGLLSFRDHKKMLEQMPKEERKYEDVIKYWKKRGWKLKEKYKEGIVVYIYACESYFKGRMEGDGFAIKFYREEGDILEYVNGEGPMSFESLLSRKFENQNYYKAQANLIEYFKKSEDEKKILIKDLVDEVVDNLLKKEPILHLDPCVMFVRVEDLIPASERGRVGILGYQLYSAFGLKKKGEEL